MVNLSLNFNKIKYLNMLHHLKYFQLLKNIFKKDHVGLEMSYSIHYINKVIKVNLL